ncbi:MAG: SUMF1/EgtB/PvdO family nonheme iron enzyme [Acidobacteriia bacterium]|nr:SUMF1/EgtB/PvdO family nonheme iron enzyme [Terriglobia bacterium]
MAALTTALHIRHDLPIRLLDARARTDEFFQIVRPEAIWDSPVAGRHPLIFYLGHLEAFDWNLLAHRGFCLQPFHTVFDDMFGPATAADYCPPSKPKDWPGIEEIQLYTQRVREKLDAAIDSALNHPEEGHPHLAYMLETAIEHRLAHAETLAYMAHRLPYERKFSRPVTPPAHPGKPLERMVEIPAGRATLGLRRITGKEFGWDNEFDAHEVGVPAFAIDVCNVTNGDFMRFLAAEGYENRALWSEAAWAWKERAGVCHPAFWKRAGNLWMYRAMFGEIRLPLDWPVYLSHAEASAYAKWLGRRLPSEEQFHRAAFGTPEGSERTYPWGEEAPGRIHGNFDFHQWDPAPVGLHPAGASAFGVQDLVGNGWEWTRSVFEPFPGFAPVPFYPQCSAKFFDGKHYVLKGGSPRTAACMLRRSFRNFCTGHAPYLYATFRCVEE